MSNPYPKPHVAVRNTLRNNGIAVGRFQDLLPLPRHEQKLGLLGFCQEVYDGAMAKEVHTKAGSFLSPDYHTCGKMIDTAKSILFDLDGSGSGGSGEDGETTTEQLAKAAFELEQKRKGKAA